MRNIRARRRLRLILCTLFVISSVLFIEARIEAFMPELKEYAEAKLGEMLGGKFRISIGSVDGGIVHPLILNGIKLERAGGRDSGVLRALKIDNIRTNYRVWDILTTAGSGQVRRDLLEKGSTVYVTFSLKDGTIKGFTGIEGDFVNAKLNGYLTFSGKDKIEFTGRIKDDAFDIELRPRTGTVRATGRLSGEGELAATVKVGHLKLAGFDVACDAVVHTRVARGADGSKGGYLEGDLETTRLELNYKPFPALKVFYTMDKESLSIPSATLGDIFKAYGKTSLVSPYAIDATFLANNVSLNWLVLMLRTKEASSILSGTLNGKFQFSGPVRKLKIDSQFEIRAGTLATLDFDSLNVHLKGIFPFLKIEDSRVTRKSGFFIMAGELDLRRAGKDNMFDDIKLLTDDGAISWDGWKVTRLNDVRQINMDKNIGQDFGVRFKKFIPDEQIDESVRDKDEVQLEYKLNTTDSLAVKVGQDKDFFGFEHRDRF